MDENRIPGLRAFLLIVLSMVSQGIVETTEFVEDSITTGIATALINKHRLFYEDASFSSDYEESVNEYYKKWNGCADGNEGKYLCEKYNGLALVIALALNEIF